MSPDRAETLEKVVEGRERSGILPGVSGDLVPLLRNAFTRWCRLVGTPCGPHLSDRRLLDALAEGSNNETGVLRVPVSGERRPAKPAAAGSTGLNTVWTRPGAEPGPLLQRGTAAFLIMGSVCTRNCRYCAVESGTPGPPDPDEPERVARAALAMGLRYAVVTSVTRDDLPDGGARWFEATVAALRNTVPGIRIEVLTPDSGRASSLETVFRSRPT